MSRADMDWYLARRAGRHRGEGSETWPLHVVATTVWDLDTRGVKVFRLGQMGDSLYYFQDRPDRWGVSPTLQLYFACILPRHSQTPRTINRILTQCLSSLRP